MLNRRSKSNEYQDTVEKTTLDSLHRLFILPVTLSMTITLLAKKGGVGKSTVCVLLHEAFKKALT